MRYHCDFPRYAQEVPRLSAVQIAAGSGHVVCMAPEDRRANLKAWMERHGLSVYKVAHDVGIPESTLYGYVRGKSVTLKGQIEARIADTYQTTVDVIFAGAVSGRAPVMGKIGARAEVRPFDEADPAYEVDVPVTLRTDEDYVAFEIEGFSMPPARPGWIVLFRKKQAPLKELEGFPCLVDLADGRRLFKDLRRGYTPGKWNLISWDGSPPMEDEEVVAALPFVAMTPGKMGR